MAYILNTDKDLFAAAITQTKIEAWLEDQNGEYQKEGSGVVEQITPDTVKLREQNGSAMHYFRYPTMFKA